MSKVKKAFKVLAIAGGIAFAGIVGNYAYFGDKSWNLYVDYKKQNPIYAQCNTELFDRHLGKISLENDLIVLNGGNLYVKSNKEQFMSNFDDKQTKDEIERSFATIRKNITRRISENKLHIYKLKKQEADYVKSHPKNPLEEEYYKRAHHPFYSLKQMFK